MVIVTINKNEVVFTLEGAEKFLALKDKVTIAIKNISNISTETVKPFWFPRFKMGSHIPGGFMAGTFWRDEGKIFYYANDLSKCIILSLKNHEYSKVVFEVDDKEVVVNDLKRVLSEQDNNNV